MTIGVLGAWFSGWGVRCVFVGCWCFWWEIFFVFGVVFFWHGVGGWVSAGSPSGVELPRVARCWSRGFVWSQQGIGLLEGRVVTGRLFVCCPGFPLPALEFQSWVFCWTAGIVVGLYRQGLYASNALLALLSICSGRRFLTSQPYFRLG